MTKEELKIKIGKQVIRIRSEQGLSQSDLARACNKDRQAIEKIENGKVNPTVYTLYEIAEALNVPLLRFFEFQSKFQAPKKETE